jgi:hypothetical protein
VQQKPLRFMKVSIRGTSMPCDSVSDGRQGPGDIRRACVLIACGDVPDVGRLASSGVESTDGDSPGDIGKK